MIGANRGMGIHKLTKADIELIDHDSIRVKQLARRGPRPNSTPAWKLEMTPGRAWTLDAFPNHANPSPIDGCVVQLLGTENVSGVILTSNEKRHTVDDWVQFTDYLDAFSLKWTGVRLVVVRVDQAPELRSLEFKKALAAKSPPRFVELAPKDEHVGAAKMESRQGPLRRRQTPLKLLVPS